MNNEVIFMSIKEAFINELDNMTDNQVAVFVMLIDFCKKHGRFVHKETEQIAIDCVHGLNGKVFDSVEEIESYFGDVLAKDALID
jgi:hypothetical protein